MDQTNYELLSPKTDIVFQTLFSRVNKNITKAFLSDILNIQINDINLDIDRQLLKQYPEEKLGVLDLRAELNNGIQCDVEIQLRQTKTIMKRLLSYWAKLYVEKLERGNEYDQLKPTICVLILDDEIEKFKEIASSYTRWQIREEKNKSTILTKDLEIIIIELPKAIKEYRTRPDDKIMQWMKFLQNPSDEEVETIMKENQNIKEAKEKLDEISQDKMLRRLAFLREKGRRDYNDGIKDATEKGIEQGVEKGIKQGEEQEKIKVINKLNKMGMKTEEIAKIVELSKENVEEYIKQLMDK